MKNPEVLRLASGEITGPIHLGRIPDVWARHLLASTRWVMFSRESFEKQCIRHKDFRIDKYEDVDWILENGEVFPDKKPNVLHFVGDTRQSRRLRTKVTVKVARSRDAIWLTSAYELREQDYESLRRRRAKVGHQ